MAAADDLLVRVLAVCRRWRGAGCLVAAALGWALAAWLIAQQLVAVSTVRVLEREQVEASSAAASIGANIGFTLAHMRNIPKVLALQPEIERILGRSGPDARRSRLPPHALRRALAGDRELALLARRLQAMVGELGVDQIWVMNAAGDCVASGGFAAEATATGVNYVDREYFWSAWRDGSGQQFAVGRTTGKAGIFHSAAVVVGGRFVGVVAVKTELARFSQLVSESRAFVTDENGIVIVAGDPRLLMRSVPKAAWGDLPREELQQRYRRSDFDGLAIAEAMLDGHRMYRFEEQAMPLIGAFASNPGDPLKVWLFREVAELPRLRGDLWGAFVLLLVGGVSLLLGVAAGINSLRRGRQHRAEIDRVNSELLKLNEELRVQAYFDALTGCRNRSYFFAEVASELARAQRFDLPCSLAMMDLDHFKDVNDRHGHATGDALLKHFAQTVVACLRSFDFVGRIGGEEFALLMPQTDLAAAREVAERIRRAVEAAAVSVGEDKEIDKIELRLTVSIGVEQWRGAGDSVESVVARADAAMYAAKHAGRNRVELARQLSSPPAA